MPTDAWQPQIVAFVCQWCTYAGADLAGTSRLVYDPSVRVVKVPCSSRIDPLFVVKAFEQGADGVLVSGCHPGDCHYVTGNLFARRRFVVLREALMFLGLPPERLQFSWVSAAEAVKWTEVVRSVTAAIRQLGPIRAERSSAVPHGGKPAILPPSTLVPPGQPAEEPHARTIGAWTQAEANMRRTGRQLLEAGEVGVLVGYEKGSLAEVMMPSFVTQAADVDRMVWNEHCVNNLGVYLTRDLVTRLGKIGIVLKGCDARSLVALLQEHQVSRDDVRVLGMPCGGMLDGGRTLAKCSACDVRTPFIFDHLVEADFAEGQAADDPRDAEIRVLEALPAGERWAYWQAEFARCVRCYACRAVCPLCYCDTCIADRSQPQWIAPASDATGNMAWNTVRALHLAGRCIGCDECARVCPATIRLDLLNRKIALVVQREYGYRAGYDASVPPPLTTYHPDDQAEFVR
jgi:coenzyme F420-reducing hydrogenase delta subunit/ferredoxin